MPQAIGNSQSHLYTRLLDELFGHTTADMNDIMYEADDDVMDISTARPAERAQKISDAAVRLPLFHGGTNCHCSCDCDGLVCLRMNRSARASVLCTTRCGACS